MIMRCAWWVSIVIGLAACGSGTPAPVEPIGNTPPVTTPPPAPLADGVFVEGTIELAPGAPPIAPGTVVFVVLKAVTTDGASGFPIAVDTLAWGDGTPLPFSLGRDHTTQTENAGFTGGAVVQARADADGDAMTKQPADRNGEAGVIVPAGGVVIRLGAAP